MSKHKQSSETENYKH